jgi:hypothetical protein
MGHPETDRRERTNPLNTLSQPCLDAVRIVRYGYCPPNEIG